MSCFFNDTSEVLTIVCTPGTPLTESTTQIHIGTIDQLNCIHIHFFKSLNTHPNVPNVKITQVLINKMSMFHFRIKIFIYNILISIKFIYSYLFT